MGQWRATAGKAQEMPHPSWVARHMAYMMMEAVEPAGLVDAT